MAYVIFKFVAGDMAESCMIAKVITDGEVCRARLFI